jgi:isoleucyl-tRNA synthetase
LSKVLAPVMPFIAERIYKQVGGEMESVHLEKWPEGEKVDMDTLETMRRVRDVVSKGLMIRTQNKIPVRQPLSLLTTKLLSQISDEYLGIIADELNVKDVVLDSNLSEDIVLDLVITEELQKEGDVRNLMRAIQDARKEKNLSPKDSVTLVISYEIPENLKEEVSKTCNIGKIELGTGTYKAVVTEGEVMFNIVK